MLVRPSVLQLWISSHIFSYGSFSLRLQSQWACPMFLPCVLCSLPVLPCPVHLECLSSFLLSCTTNLQIWLLIYIPRKPKRPILSSCLPLSPQQYFSYYVYYFLPHMCQTISLHHLFIFLYTHTMCALLDCPERNKFLSLPTL